MSSTSCRDPQCSPTGIIRFHTRLRILFGHNVWQMISGLYDTVTSVLEQNWLYASSIGNTQYCYSGCMCFRQGYTSCCHRSTKCYLGRRIGCSRTCCMNFHPFHRSYCHIETRNCHDCHTSYCRIGCRYSRCHNNRCLRTGCTNRPCWLVQSVTGQQMLCIGISLSPLCIPMRWLNCFAIKHSYYSMKIAISIN